MKQIHRYITSDRVLALVYVIFGLIGYLDTVYGTWRAGPGFGAKFFPQITFLALLICGIIMMFIGGKDGGKPSEIISLNELKALVILVGMGVLYFIIVRSLGLVVSSLLYFLTVFSIFTVQPLRNYKMILIPALISTAVVWLLFTQLVQLLLPNPLLF